VRRVAIERNRNAAVRARVARGESVSDAADAEVVLLAVDVKVILSPPCIFP
jgi:hypothetical protein